MQARAWFLKLILCRLSVCVRACVCVFCHATTGPPKIGPPGPFVSLQMVPPDQLWCRGWSPFSTAGPPYNPTFISYFLSNHSNVKI